MDYSNRDLSATYLDIASKISGPYQTLCAQAKLIGGLGPNLYEVFQREGSLGSFQGVLNSKTRALLEDMLEGMLRNGPEATVEGYRTVTTDSFSRMWKSF